VAPGDRFVEMVGTLFGLARDGKVNPKGLPSLLQLAVTASAYRDVMIIASPPPWLQRPVFFVLAQIGHAAGLKPCYQQYLSSDEIVEPASDALALVTEDGRLREAAA
jgi:hypothetical protein